MFDEERIFMDVLDMCNDLSDEYLNALIDNIEVMIENREEESEEKNYE